MCEKIHYVLLFKSESYCVPYFPVVLFIMPRKVGLAFEIMNDILKCENSNESYCLAVHFSVCEIVYHVVQSGLKFSHALWMRVLECNH